MCENNGLNRGGWPGVPPTWGCVGVGTTRGGWKVVSECPPPEGSMASLKHKGTGKESAPPSS